MTVLWFKRYQNGMDYSLRELECFTAVAEELSFTRAARRLRLSQPPLSRHVRELEEKLGARLFEREGRRVALTEAGALFHEGTRHVLADLTRAGEAARRHAAGETSRLRLGFVSAVLSPRLVEVLRVFRERHPEVQLSMRDAPPAEQLAALAGGSLDGGFVGLKPAEAAPGVRFHAWSREPLAAFVPRGHRLAERRTLALKELAGEGLVGVSAEAAPAFAAHLRELCRQAGFRPRVMQESPRAQAVAVMVAAGAGIALLPVSLERVVEGAAAVIPLGRTPPLTHVFAHRGGRVSAAMERFLALLDESVKT